MKPWLIGAKANWPKDEAAVAMPKIIGRFSGGTERPNAAMTTLNEQMAMPTPVMMPAVSDQDAGAGREGHEDDAGGIDDGAQRRWCGRCRRDRRNSPAKGWAMPQARFWMAMAMP